MKIFPTKELKFKLIDDQAETLNRLNRRTEKSENLTSSHTDKSFRGIIKGNEFKLISSAIGKGAFCVMTGVIETDKGNVKIEIYKVFRILLSIILCFPIVGILITILTGQDEPNTIFNLLVSVKILIITHACIDFAFKL